MAVRLVSPVNAAPSFAAVDKLPNVQRTDTSSVSASKWLPVMPVIVACVVKAAAILVPSSFTGSAGNNWNFHLAVSRASESNPITLVGIHDIATRISNSSGSNMQANVPWTFVASVFDATNQQLLPGDVLGFYLEMTGAPTNLQANTMYAVRVEPS